MDNCLTSYFDIFAGSEKVANVRDEGIPLCRKKCGRGVLCVSNVTVKVSGSRGLPTVRVTRTVTKRLSRGDSNLFDIGMVPPN